MRIVFDPAKDKLNLADHGVSLALARELAWDEALVWLDDRFGYDELRMIGLVPRGAIVCTTWPSWTVGTRGESSACASQSEER